MPPSHFRPSVEVLEGRDVPNAAAAIQNVQLIAELLPAIRANLPVLAQIPEVANILETIRDTSRSDYSELSEFSEEVADALESRIGELEQQRAEMNAQIAAEFDAGVAAADDFVATLPPDQQAAVAGAVAQYKMTLGQGAQAKLVRTGDFIGGQEVLSIEYASELNTFLIPIVAQAAVNVAESEQLAQAVPASSGGGDGGGGGGGSVPPGGGQYVQLGITLGDGTLLYGIDRDGDGVANGDDTYILVNGQYQQISLPL